MVQITRFPTGMFLMLEFLNKYAKFNLKFLSFISYYSTISTEESAYFIGGCAKFNCEIPPWSRREGYSTIIARYFNDQWVHVGDLTTGRYKHRSLLVGNRVYIIGGRTQE